MLSGVHIIAHHALPLSARKLRNACEAMTSWNRCCFAMDSLTFALQALLARHEAYLADAARDRLELTDRIEQLRSEKQTLEAENASKVEENRVLRDQLEPLNCAITESDTRIKSLEASLLSSQHTIRQLEAASTRAADAERHIAFLEEEQDRLYQELRSTREDSRSHAQRFKEAQRGILDMQDQLDRMETEGRQEQERHAQVLQRMERQRDIDKQLDIAAGRLKAAAATRSLNDPQKGNKAVGHFVRDLLQDNAKLQLGIAELRELLLNSNDEIQTLRGQLAQHQPLPDEGVQTPVLQAELDPNFKGVGRSPGLHIHHHYHVTPTQESRKPKRRRPALLAGARSIMLVSGTPTLPSRMRKQLITSPTAPALLSKASAMDGTPLLPKQHNSWTATSIPPSEFSSSLPSSPPSEQYLPVFDQALIESEPLTSPATSLDSPSPLWKASYGKRYSVASLKSLHKIQVPELEPTLDDADIPRGILNPNSPLVHQEQTDSGNDEQLPGTPHFAKSPFLKMRRKNLETPPFLSGQSADYPTLLRRASSHESMSLAGGLEIHTLMSRPSQMALRPLGGADAIITGVTAQPTLLHGAAKRSDMALRDNFAALQTPRSSYSPLGQVNASRMSSGGSRRLGRLIAWRPWAANSNSSAWRGSSKAPDVAAAESAQESTSAKDQGPISGFFPAQHTQSALAQVTATRIDHDALAEGLQE